MRYSYGVLIDWLGFKIAPEDCDFIDTHWSACGHHKHRAAQAQTIADRNFHERLFIQHLNCLKFYVFNFANFEDGWDRSGRNMHIQSNWFPDGIAPDPAAWNSLEPDKRFSVGEHHCSDAELFVPNVVHLTV